MKMRNFSRLKSSNYMMKLIIPTIGMLFALFAQANAQDLVSGPKVVLLNGGTLDMVNSTLNDGYQKVSGKAQDGGYPDMRQPAPWTGLVGLGVTSSVTASQNQAFNTTTVTGKYESGLAQSGNSQVFFGTTAIGEVKTRSWWDQLNAESSMNRQYRVILAPGSSFGILKVEHDAGLKSKNAVTGSGSAIISNQRTGKMIGVNLDEKANNFVANTYDVGFLPNQSGQTEPVEKFRDLQAPTWFSHFTDGSGLEGGVGGYGYLVVRNNDIITLSSSSKINTRNTATLSSGFIEGKASSESTLRISVMSFYLDPTNGTQNHFPRYGGVGETPQNW